MKLLTTSVLKKTPIVAARRQAGRKFSQVVAFREENASEGQKTNQGANAKVVFKLPKHVQFGDTIVAVGEDERLGKWNPNASQAKLEWQEGDVWTGELDVQSGLQIAYKYVITNGKGKQEWLPGENLVVSVPENARLVQIHDSWDGEHGIEIDPSPESSQARRGPAPQEGEHEEGPEPSQPTEALAPKVDFPPKIERVGAQDQREGEQEGREEAPLTQAAQDFRPQEQEEKPSSREASAPSGRFEIGKMEINMPEGLTPESVTQREREHEQDSEEAPHGSTAFYNPTREAEQKTEDRHGGNGSESEEGERLSQAQAQSVEGTAEQDSPALRSASRKVSFRGKDMELSSMNLSELRAFAKSKGLRITGSKEDVEERVRAHLGLGQDEQEEGEEKGAKSGAEDDY